MAHSLSAQKRVRQNIKQRALDRARRSALRAKLRKCNEAFLHGSVEDAESTFRAVCKTLDREADLGTLHRNAAARRKSRLARRLNAVKQAATG